MQGDDVPVQPKHVEANVKKRRLLKVWKERLQPRLSNARLDPLRQPVSRSTADSRNRHFLVQSGISCYIFPSRRMDRAPCRCEGDSGMRLEQHTHGQDRGGKAYLNRS
jgi:hypothetical protein